MISLAERTSRISIKDLVMEEPRTPGRLRPEIDLTHGINWAHTVLESTSLPEHFKGSIKFLDSERLVLFATETQYENMKKLGTWEEYMKGNYIQKKTGIKLLLSEKAEIARSEHRNMTHEDAVDVKDALLELSKSAEDINELEISEHLRTVADYPEVLVWLAEILTFQESTLSIPDYSRRNMPLNETRPMPSVRRF